MQDGRYAFRGKKHLLLPLLFLLPQLAITVVFFSTPPVKRSWGRSTWKTLSVFPKNS